MHYAEKVGNTIILHGPQVTRIPVTMENLPQGPVYFAHAQEGFGKSFVGTKNQFLQVLHHRFPKPVTLKFDLHECISDPGKKCYTVEHTPDPDFECSCPLCVDDGYW